MADMPENITLSELRSTQTFYLGPKRRNSSKCYLTLAEFARAMFSEKGNIDLN